MSNSNDKSIPNNLGIDKTKWDEFVASAYGFPTFAMVVRDAEISSLKSQLEGAFGLANLRHDDLDKFHTAIHHRDRSLDDIGVHGWIRTSVENLRAEFDAKDAEISGLKSQLAASINRSSSLSEDLNKAEIAQLRSVIAANDAELEGVIYEVKRLEKLSEEFRKGMNTASEGFQSRGKELATKDADISVLMHDVSMLNLDVERLRRIKEARDAEIVSLKVEIARINSAAEEKESGARAFVDFSGEAYGAEIDTLRAEISELKQKDRVKLSTEILNNYYSLGVSSQKSEVERVKKELETVRALRDKWQQAFLTLSGDVSRTVETAKRNVGFGG